MRTLKLCRVPAGIALCLALFHARTVIAQPAPAPAPKPVEPAPAPAQPAPTAPVPPPQPAPAPEKPEQPAPQPPQVEQEPERPAPQPPPPAAPAHAHAHEAETPDLHPLAEPHLNPVPAESDSLPWYDSIEFRAFVDSYFTLNYNMPKPQTGENGKTRAYDTENGFALAWVGIDATYPAEPVGGTLSLRFGPSAQRIAGSCLEGTCDDEAVIGLANVKQAFAAWRPGGAGSAVQLDFGKFDTIYGAEVAESQDNINYTRGVVYWFAQPLFHTGLRMSAELGSLFTLKAMLVNGYNNSVDNNLGKDLGVQLGFQLPRGDYSGTLLTASLGYLVGPERNDYSVIDCPADQHFDPTETTGCAAGAPATGESSSGAVDRASANWKGLRNLIDLVVTLTPTDALTVLLNADLGFERVRDTLDPQRFVQHMFWGGMLGARYSFADPFAIAARVEYLSDKDGFFTGYAGNDIELVTATLTLDYRPADYLILRLDNRLDWSSKQIFQESVRDASGILPTTTLGVVVTTN
ncbi:MAG TPA: outer membrane beta-barrel protein [Polyangiaceae bacterium]